MALDNCGEESEDNKMAVQDVRKLEEIIKSQSPETEVKCVVDKCAIHNIAAVSKRLPDALYFLLKKR